MKLFYLSLNEFLVRIGHDIKLGRVSLPAKLQSRISIRLLVWLYKFLYPVGYKKENLSGPSQQVEQFLNLVCIKVCSDILYLEGAGPGLLLLRVDPAVGLETKCFELIQFDGRSII